MSFVKILKHSYRPGSFEVDIRDWNLADRGVTVLWGPSGVGKSSILRLLMGLDRADQFEWTFQGEDLHNQSIQQRRIGAVFQDSSLFWGLTAEQNLQFAVTAAIQGRGLSQFAQQETLKFCIERLELEPLLKRPAELLSGGERSRVALARALVGKPRILMLDEPFASLDLERKKLARRLVKDLIEEFKIPALLVTHDEADFDRAVDTVVRISAGKKLD